MITSQSQINISTFTADNKGNGIESNCNAISFINSGNQDLWIYNDNSGELKLTPGASINFNCESNITLTDTWYWYFNDTDGAELSIVTQSISKQD